MGPRSLSQAAFMAPRTTKAPWSGVQKITGWSAPENVAIRLEGPIPPSDSLAVGKPRSLPTGPPSDSYLARTSLSTALAPVAGLPGAQRTGGAAGRTPRHIDRRGRIACHLQTLELVGQRRGISRELLGLPVPGDLTAAELLGSDVTAVGLIPHRHAE